MAEFLHKSARLDFDATSSDNFRMKLHGHIQNGVVALDGNPTLPEGAVVTVVVGDLAPPVASPLPETEIVCESGKLPYVRGGTPGAWHLTNDMIARFFEEEDLAMMKDALIDRS
jgi:hypothetical protein